MSVEEAVDMYVIPAKMDDAMEWPAQKVEDDLNMLRRAYALDAASCVHEIACINNIMYFFK